MRLLLDTHLLLWAALDMQLLPANARELMMSPGNELFFSTVNVWEVAIKFSQNRTDFMLPPRRFFMAMLQRGYQELAITSEQVSTVAELPPIHKDPFDRLLVAQAMVEELTLVTVDETILKYPGPILRG